MFSQPDCRKYCVSLPPENIEIMAHKKLYRTRNDAKIAGVCGGLAEYLDIDVTIVRIVFLLLLLTGSLGFWIYLIIWIVAPWDYMVK